MKFLFTNSFHGTTASVTCKDWRISQRQVRRLWTMLCGETDCVCGYGGVEGPNKYYLRKRFGKLYNDGAEIVAQ